MVNYALILARKFNNAEWMLNGDDYSGLNWLSDSPKPSKKTLDDLWETVQAEIISEQEDKASRKTALLDRLGITEEEAKLILG
jgi:hypothetical protein